MNSLSDLTLKTSYHKGEDDIAQAFYLPCMRRSVTYGRAVGYFRSTIFILAWPALREFVAAGGRMRVLCSQVLPEDDVNAIREGYDARADTEVARRLEVEIADMLRDPTLREPTKILAALVSRGVIELKVAVLTDAVLRSRGRIFHDKLGIFRDAAKNTVIFKGSMNETWIGLSPDGNIESVDIAASWMGLRDQERVANEVQYFEDLWANRYPTVDVLTFPDVVLETLRVEAAPDWEEALERALLAQRSPAVGDHRGRVLKPHQAAGLAAWHANGRHGILAFATGSGKTFTALAAIRDAVCERSEPTIVVVPDKVLFAQWHGELKAGLAGLDVGILKAGAGNARWRESLRLWTGPGPQRRIVLATLPTATSDDFLVRIDGGTHVFLVADEVHRLGAQRRRRLMVPSMFGPRLGLSATPERAGDPEGTAVLLDFFGGVLEPRYTLSDAVRDGVLCRYFYRPHPVHLTQQELDAWNEIASRVNTIFARLKSGEDQASLRNQLSQLLFKRARIVKNASAKVPLAVGVLTEVFERNQRWIVYCDNVSQLEAVMQALKVAGLSPMPYHSQMEADRAGTLRWLDAHSGIVVAIKCLDEGVDIPSVSHALILASSKNPREFIQRRGRVLRTAHGKTLAHIHDAVVLPPAISGGETRTADPITVGEVARALEFAEHAENPAGAAELKGAALAAGLSWNVLSRMEGIEDDGV